MVVKGEKVPLCIGRDQSVGPVYISVKSINNQSLLGHQHPRAQYPPQMKKDILLTISLHYFDIFGVSGAEHSVELDIILIGRCIWTVMVSGQQANPIPTWETAMTSLNRMPRSLCRNQHSETPLSGYD
jgi:hypothetical protein